MDTSEDIFFLPMLIRTFPVWPPFLPCLVFSFSGVLLGARRDILLSVTPYGPFSLSN